MHTASPFPGAPGPDLWHHYGRDRAERDRAVPAAFCWAWDQGTGPGAELLGRLDGRVVADLGAGAGRHAAHLASWYGARRVVAVESSPAQYGFAAGLYGHLAPRLRIAASRAEAHLRAAAGGYDVLYSVFGALCFTDPRRLIPLASRALRPGGRLVFSTLAHHVGGLPARAEAAPSEIPARTPEGQPATLRRWVLRPEVWTALLDDAGFTRITADLLPATEPGPRTADTLLMSCELPGAS